MDRLGLGGAPSATSGLGQSSCVGSGRGSSEAAEGTLGLVLGGEGDCMSSAGVFDRDVVLACQFKLRLPKDEGLSKIL